MRSEVIGKPIPVLNFGAAILALLHESDKFHGAPFAVGRGGPCSLSAQSSGNNIIALYLLRVCCFCCYFIVMVCMEVEGQCYRSVAKLEFCINVSISQAEGAGG
jgi:hypothetical protein